MCTFSSSGEIFSERVKLFLKNRDNSPITSLLYPTIFARPLTTNGYITLPTYTMKDMPKY